VGVACRNRGCCAVVRQKDFQVKNFFVFVLIGVAIVLLVSQFGKKNMANVDVDKRMKELRAIKKRKAQERQSAKMKIAA
jgi:hypothetical protein